MPGSKGFFNFNLERSFEMSKVWLITGCSKGFGRALAKELLESTKDLVVASARNPETLKDLEENYTDRVLAVKLDVTRQEDIDGAVEAATKRFGRIDVLVNNAGYGLMGVLEECSMEEIRKLFDTNVFGLMAMTKAVLPHMRNRGSGRILNISSVGGLVAMGGSGMYVSSKFAVEGFSESLAMDIESFGIKVILVEPGPFRTDFAGGSLKMTAEHPDYKGTASTRIRKYAVESDKHQPGDPMKAAKIMIQLVNMENPPLRMLLGSVAIERIIPKLTEQMEQIRVHEAWARSADFDS